MLKIGLTGGIGSGKSTVARIFEVLGIPVYYADERAKAIMQEKPEVVKAIKDLLGTAAYQSDGSIDRKYIASRVFKDEDLLKALEAIVHPAVGRDADQWHSRQHAPYTIREAALLYENGSYRQMDAMITVFAPKEIRIQRVMKRDQISREAVLDRLGKQMLDEEKVKLADYLIHNDEHHSLIEQVLEIHQKLKKRSST